MPVKKKPPVDPRINAPLISFRAYLVMFGVVYLLVVAQSMIVVTLMNRVPTLIGVLAAYCLMAGLLMTILLGVNKRYIYGRSIQSIAKAARQVTQGDYTVRLSPNRKDGKKDEVAVLIEDFNKMVETLASVEILKSDFISNVSHEIKAPLSVIQNYSQALRDTDLTDETRREYADTIIAASMRLSSMVSNILRLNKLENAELRSKPSIYPLGEQLRQCALSFMDAWTRKGVDFSIDVADVTVQYDATLLELVWNNLLSNAVKFVDEGGGITLTSVQNEEHVAVTLFNSGAIIPMQQQSRIFDKFYQSDTSHATEGNGLGLALVKKVLDMVGGTIRVESDPVIGGTAFHVSLNVKNDY